MHKAMKCAREFNDQYGISVAEIPHLPLNDSLREIRQKTLYEGFKNYRKGERKNDIVEISEGLARMVYIICCTSLDYGIPLDRIFYEVHRSNMTGIGDDHDPPHIAKIITDSIYGESNED